MLLTHLVVLPAAAAARLPVERCDLTVLVMAAAAGSPQIALSYSRQIDHERLRAGIERLVATTGAQPGEIVIQDGALGRGSAEIGTAAEFPVRGLLRPQQGMLPVGAIIRSLPDWHRMRLVFVVGEDFAFRGPLGAVADGFVVRVVNRVKAYEYDVERMSGRIAPPDESQLSRPRSAALLPAILLGAPIGLLLGWFIGDRRTREGGN